MDITPDYVVKVGEVRIADADQAAVRNIRDFDGKPIWIPTDDRLKPDRELLRTRLELAS